MVARDDDFCEEKKEKSTERFFDRRSLAKGLGAAAAAALVSRPLSADEVPAPPSRQIADSRTDALVEAALSATPASLTAEQRLAVRRGVRDLQKALADARRVALPYEIDPATVFLPGGRR
jgi:hypothetical protein